MEPSNSEVKSGKKLFKLIIICFSALILLSLLFYSSNKTLVFSDPKKEINVSKGQEFNIRVMDGGVVGYKWKLRDDWNKSIIKYLKKEINTDRVGDFVVYDYQFKTIKKGKTAITFEWNEKFSSMVFNVTIK